MRNTEKKKYFVARFFGVTVILCVLALMLQGCAGARPGETSAESRRRLIRNRRIARQQLMEDLDKVLLTAEPSRLSGKRIP